MTRIRNYTEYLFKDVFEYLREPIKFINNEYPLWYLLFVSGLAILFLVLFLSIFLNITAVASFSVAVVAVLGILSSQVIYQRREYNKYKPVIIASFDNDYSEDTTESATINKLLDGFYVKNPNEIYEVLISNIVLKNISKSPVTDIKANFYIHSNKNGKPYKLFKYDGVPLCQGLPENSSESVEINEPFGGGRVTDNFVSSIRNTFSGYLNQNDGFKFKDKESGITKSISNFSLVIKYKNILGDSYFSVYKIEINYGTTNNDESTEMVFYGSFRGEYLKDSIKLGHAFVANKGFPSKELAPDWTTYVEPKLPPISDESQNILQAMRNNLNH